MNTEQRIPPPAYLNLVAELREHAVAAGLTYFDQARRQGHAKKIGRELSAIMPASSGARTAFLTEWLRHDLTAPVVELIRAGAVESIDRAELFSRAAIVGESVVARLFVDNGAN